MKKTLLTFSVLLVLLHVSGQSFYNYNGSGITTISSGNTTIIGHNIYLGPTSYNASGSSLVVAKATNEVDLKPELYVTPGASGFAHFYIDADAIDVASFHPNGFTGIPTYDRFELGVKLPSTIQSQINTFLTTYSSPPNQPVPGLNPYDPDQITIECVVTPPSGPSFTRYGFYYQPYSVANNTYIEGTTDYPFRIRIAPPQAGLYHCNVNVYIPNQPTLSWNDIQFTAFSSGKHGNLVMADQSIQKMKFEDETTFFGVGEGMTAPDYVYNETSPGGNPSFNYDYNPNGYKTKASPATQDIFRTRLNDIADKGGNFARVWFLTWAFPLEYADFRSLVTSTYCIWNCVNNYQHNQMFLWEFDNCLDVFESRNLYMMLNIFNDQNTNSGNGQFRWNAFPYSALLGEPEDGDHKATYNGVYKFFSSTLAKTVFKKQLFYITARWGYSANIAMWEMINETENINNYKPNDPPDPSTLALRAEIKNWVCEMASYMKGFYPVHLTTNGTIGVDFRDDTWTNQCLDIYSTNSYNNEINAGSPMPDHHDQISDKHHEDGNGYFNMQPPMPFIIGEVGLGATCAHTLYPADQNSWLIGDKFNDRAFHNNLWATMVSGNVVTGMYNNDISQPYIDHRANFKAIRNFADHVDWTKPLIPQRYAAHSPNITIGTDPNDPNQTSHILYNLYMQNKAHSYVVGWSMIQPSFWVYDENYSSFPATPGFNDMLLCAGYQQDPNNILSMQDYNHFSDYNVSPELGDAWIEIRHMNQPNRWYRAQIYDPYDASITIFSTPVLSDNDSIIKFHLPFYNHRGPDNNFIPPDRAYVIYDDADTYNWDSENMEERSKNEYYKVIQYSEDMVGKAPKGRSAADPVEIVTYDKGKTIKKKVLSSDLPRPEAQSPTLYPNPTSNFVTIDYNDAYYTNTEITVSDLAGKIIRKTTGMKKLYLGDLDQGMYLILFHSDQIEKTFKITVGH